MTALSLSWLCIAYVHMLVIVLTNAQYEPFRGVNITGKCYKDQGVKYSGTILKQITAHSTEECCAHCQKSVDGERPCTAFALETSTSQCHLLSNVSDISEDPAYISGHSASKLYKLTRQNEEPIGAAILSSPEAKSAWHCGMACLEHPKCLAFSWMPLPVGSPSCTLLNIDDVDTTFHPLSGNKFFQMDYTPADAVPINCSLSQWSEWTNCSENSDGCQNRSRSIVQPAVHGGSDEQCQQPLYEERYQTSSSMSSPATTTLASTLALATTSISTTDSTSSTALTTPPPGETHILIFSGRNSSGEQQDIIDFMPETKTFTVLNTKTQYKMRYRNIAVWGDKVFVDGGRGTSIASFEVFDGMPLVGLANPVVPIRRYFGCGGVANAKFYACFGRGGDANVGKTCDVYDLNNNYAHTTLNMQIGNELSLMSCVFMDNYVYTVGGAMNGNNHNVFYRFSLNDGTVTALSNYRKTVANSAAVMYQGNILVCGGNPTTDECHLYDFTSSQWQSFANLNTAAYGLSCVNWGSDKILCTGGKGTSGYSDKVELYENGAWTEYANMPYRMGAHTAVSVCG